MKKRSNQPTLPEPTCCDDCNSPNIAFAKNSIVYGKEYGEWPYCWFCKDCKAMVGVHARSKTPLGKMASSAVRRLRAKAHDAFDPLWQRQYMARNRAYNWLAGHLDIPAEQCHISWLNEAQLKQAITFVTDYLLKNETALIKRKVKRDARRTDTNRHLSNRIRARKNGA